MQAPVALPADPADRAFVRLLIFRDNELTSPYYALRRGDDGAAEAFDAALGRFDALLGERPYLGGAEYGLADIAHVPWFLRARDMLELQRKTRYMLRGLWRAKSESSRGAQPHEPPTRPSLAGARRSATTNSQG